MSMLAKLEEIKRRGAKALRIFLARFARLCDLCALCGKKYSLFSFTSLAAFSMTLEEQVGQLLLPHFVGEEINEDAKRLIHEAHVGGFVYYQWTNILRGPQEVKKLSEDLQKESSFPLIIAVDQEGGVVARLKKGFTVFPSNAVLGQCSNKRWIQEAAYATAQELLFVGINMNLAPVVDVNCNPLNPVIGSRSFGSNPRKVAVCGKQALMGYKAGGVIPVLKHFPGHGDVTVDSHIDLPVVSKSLKELEAIELYPFRKLIPHAEVIMTAHLLLPALDPHLCATFSPKILQELLRKKLGFSGIIVSDSLAMHGALKQAGSLEKAALDAFLAGCDLLMLSGQKDIGTAEDVLRVHRYLVAAVKEGVISQERLNASLQRIFALKEKIQKKKPSIKVDFEKHAALSELLKKAS